MAEISIKIDNETQSYTYEEVIKGEAIYCINEDSVSIINDSNIDALKEDIKWLDAFKPYLASIHIA